MQPTTPTSLTTFGVALDSLELQSLIRNKQSGYNYRYRRYNEWTETYEFYRDKVQINRLVQRQSINVPLMKQTVAVILKDIDQMPELYFENLDNDKQAEVFKNEYWKYTVEQNDMVLQDIVDKKQELLFGRSFDQWQVVDGKIKMTVQDPMDILVDRYCDPYNIHSSRFLIHAHIFKPLSTLNLNKDYDKEAVAKLQEFYTTQQGFVKAADNQKMYVERQRRLTDLGVLDAMTPILGETIIELSLHFVYRKEDDDEEEQLYLYVEADNMVILMKKRLEEVIGETADHFWRNHYPYVSWAGDLERQDFWSDGVGDIVRPINKVINAYISQEIENRTLKNYSMKYYNSSLEGFNPDTFNPVPWGFYPIPVPTNGKISDVVQDIVVPDLGQSFQDIDYLQRMSDTATSANPIQQGVPLPGRVPLGEAKMVLDQSTQRVKGASKFYLKAWEDRGLIFIKLLEAAGDKIEAVTVYKKGRNTDNIYKRTIAPTDWKTASGYRCRVWSKDEKQAEAMKEIQTLSQAVALMPDNPIVNTALKQKILESADLPADQVQQAIQYEQQKQMMIMQQMAAGIIPGQQPGQSVQPGMPSPQGASVPANPLLNSPKQPYV